MNSKLLVLGMLGPLVVSGCGTTVGVTYYTSPDGAMLAYKDGSQQHGITPIRLEYQWDQRFVANGCLKTKGVMATWSSGARAESPEIITVCGGPGEYNYKLDRPSTGDGLDKDLSFALDVQKTRAMQQQAEQARVQSELQMLQLFNAMNPPTQNVDADVDIKANCISRTVGNNVYTECK